jgi:thiol-disulfide isomerase/thioredoxin
MVNVKVLRTFFIVAVLFVWMSGAAAALEEGSSAPAFTLKDLQGREIALAAFAGRPLVLKLTTTWCPACQMMSAEVARIARRLADMDVAGMDVFLQDSDAMIRHYLQHWDPGALRYAAVVDDGRVMEDYNVYLIPRVLLLDAKLHVARDGGLISGDDIIRWAEKAVSGAENVP